MLESAGRDYDLAEAAGRFRQDCFGTRLDHYYWHFISWEKMCWITKNFILPRTLRGATLDYEKIARSSFHIRLSLSENMRSDRDIMLFFFGFMTTGSSQEKLEITVTDLSVSSHMAEFDVKYGRRSWYSALAFNPLRCYGQTRYELQRANADLVEQQRELARHTAMLEKAFLAVSNSVFVFQEGRILRANRAARDFVEKGIVDLDQVARARKGKEFSSALKRLQNDFRDSFGFTVELHEKGYPQFGRSSDWGELYLILQECLRNAWRHSGSEHADVVLSENRIEVRDGGVGLSPDSATETGIGLKSIRSRSEKIGFESATLPSPGNGWLFTRSGSLER